MLLNMLQDSTGKNVKEVLMADFSRVTQSVAEHICAVAGSTRRPMPPP